jgi:GTP cyclohydrolase-4
MLFSREEHQRALECGSDVPAENPAFAIELTEIGITNKTVWVHLAGQTGILPFKAEVLLRLSGANRGIHMSRIEQAVTDLHGKEFKDLRSYALTLGRRIMTGQCCEGVTIRLAGEVPFLQNTPVSRNLSIDTAIFSVQATFCDNSGKPSQVIIGVSVHHLTACPCTLSYNQVLFDAAGSAYPQPTHTQRSKTLLRVESPGPSFDAPTFEDITACLTSTLHIAHDLLKRADEAELVVKAHLQPQFAEDVVRDIASETGRMFISRLPASTRVIIESISLESIHIHDVVCRLETTLDQIIKISPGT